MQSCPGHPLQAAPQKGRRMMIYLRTVFWFQVEQYASQQLTPVMIISYEMLLRNFEVIEKLGFDLLVCDEAHRLKNPAIKTTHLLASLPCKKRILVTGTPLQNDLQVSRNNSKLYFLSHHETVFFSSCSAKGTVVKSMPIF